LVVEVAGRRDVAQARRSHALTPEMDQHPVVQVSWDDAVA
jgi:formylglycine-generating enzyme required for sulfatase activity